MARTLGMAGYLKNTGKIQGVDKYSQPLNWEVFKVIDTETYHGESVRVMPEQRAG